MAKNTKKSSSSSSSSGKSRLSLNKFSFWVIVATTLLYFLAMLFHFIHFNHSAALVGWLQGIATACAIIIAAILAWRYVANKAIVWKVLYILCMIAVVAFIIVPLVI